MQLRQQLLQLSSPSPSSGRNLHCDRRWSSRPLPLLPLSSLATAALLCSRSHSAAAEHLNRFDSYTAANERWLEPRFSSPSKRRRRLYASIHGTRISQPQRILRCCAKWCSSDLQHRPSGSALWLTGQLKCRRRNDRHGRSCRRWSWAHHERDGGSFVLQLTRIIMTTAQQLESPISNRYHSSDPNVTSPPGSNGRLCR